VVLESNKRKSKARVAVKPELEGNVERVFRGTLGDLVKAVGYTRAAEGIAVLTALEEGVDKLGYIANHLGITGLLASLLGKLIPYVEPVAILLVNALATDLKLNGLDKIVTRPVEPAELGARAVRGLKGDLGEGGLEVHAIDQVTVALNSASDLLTEVRGTIERVLNGLHGKVGVTTVHNLEKCNLRVTG